MECGDGSEISSRVCGGREDGVMESLAAPGFAQSDWVSVRHPALADCRPLDGRVGLRTPALSWCDSIMPIFGGAPKFAWCRPDVTRRLDCRLEC